MLTFNRRSSCCFSVCRYSSCTSRNSVACRYNTFFHSYAHCVCGRRSFETSIHMSTRDWWYFRTDRTWAHTNWAVRQCLCHSFQVGKDDHPARFGMVRQGSVPQHRSRFYHPPWFESAAQKSRGNSGTCPRLLRIHSSREFLQLKVSVSVKRFYFRRLFLTIRTLKSW